MHRKSFVSPRKCEIPVPVFELADRLADEFRRMGVTAELDLAETVSGLYADPVLTSQQ